jgi:hypothetical protein
MLDRGLTGYCAPTNNRPCHLLLSEDESLRVSVVATDVARRFECFSLALEIDKAPQGSATAFVTRKDDNATFVLIREEYTEPFTGDPSSLGLIGQPPTTAQQAARPGHVPAHALESCVVAFGLLIEGDEERLVVAAGWSPYKQPTKPGLPYSPQRASLCRLLATSDSSAPNPADHRFVRKRS